MSIWEARDLCKKLLSIPSITEEQRKAIENALESLELHIKVLGEEKTECTNQ